MRNLEIIAIKLKFGTVTFHTKTKQNNNNNNNNVCLLV